MTLWFPLSLVMIALLVLSNLWLLRRVYSPLRRLSAQTNRLASGDKSAFQAECGGIAEIDQLRHSLATMAGHVGRAQDEGLVYRSALTNGQEAERARIARELHDDTVQSLIAIAQSLDMAAAWTEQDPARAAEMIKLARGQTIETADNVRRMIANLRPPALEELGLVPALKMLAQQSHDLNVVVQVEGQPRRLDEAQELALFRSVQEALRNAQKHSAAQHLIIRVCYQRDEVSLTIRDDGRGFVVPQPLETLARAGHYGMVGMAERVQSLGGTLAIDSTPQRGVQLAITLPVRSADQPTEMVRDPVCAAVIQPEQAYGSLVYEGERYYFCCPVCQGAFQRQPEVYLTSGS